MRYIYDILEKLDEYREDLHKIKKDICLMLATTILLLLPIYIILLRLSSLEELVGSIYQRTCPVSSPSSPSDLVLTSPKVSLSPFPPKRTMMFGDWQSNLHDHCQTEQGFQKETLGQGNNLSQHDPM